MEDRYEIRGKIGAGGLGTVYRGFDLKMKRQVAIKRIITSNDDPSLQEEATKQLAAEAGALASLQHPHIVTVYDVGHDEDGPYVVMELINGKTLDDIIEEHPLTWNDFRELAMQTQEALIAAQELNMIHSDLKPPNIMMTWLPSGKFQVKIVDFGLAMLAQNQSKEELETIETVFGSIFFMPPEQFEREVLDARSDLYSMGCVYYQCLTGKYPFTGTDGSEVMEAHLNHTVTPIQDIRADVPVWVCDWVMWQINRNREDRPQSAKEALAVFIQNNRQPNPEMSTGRPPRTGPKLILPGAPSADPGAPEPIYGKPIIPPGDLETVEMMAGFDEPMVEPEPDPGPPMISKTTRVQPAGALLSPTSRISTIATSSAPSDGSTPTEPAVTTPMVRPPKPPMSTAAKGMIAVVLGIAIIFVGWMYVSQSGQNAANARLNALLSQAAQPGAKEVPMSSEDLQMLLKTAAFTGAVENREDYYALLRMAKSTDGTNFDISILNFAKDATLLSDVRTNLIAEVLHYRANPDIFTLLLDFGIETTDKTAAVASFRAAHEMGNEAHVDRYLDVIVDPKLSLLRGEAESGLGRIIDNAANRNGISAKVAAAYDRASDSVIRHTLIRLLGRCSTDLALQQITKGLSSEDAPTRTAASVALGDWKDTRAIDVLLKYLDGVSDAKLRLKAYEALLKVAAQDFALADEAKAQDAWNKIKDEATTKDEKMKFINAAVIMNAPWRKVLVQPFTQDADGDVAKYATRGVAKIDELDKLKQKEKGGK